MIPDGAPYIDATPVPVDVSTEPWSPEAAAWRLDRLRAHLPVRVPKDATFAGGQANDAWLFDGDVLRVCWRSDRRRLLREARILEELPDDIPHAAVSAAGAAEDMSWVLSPRLPGQPLFTMEHVSAPVLRDVFRQLAGHLRALHAWSPSPSLRDELIERPDMSFDRPMSVWAADFVPLPMARLEVVASLARSVPFVDPALVDAATARIGSLARHDPFSPEAELGDACVVHGDATAANVMVHDGRISGLIDFEYARWAPRDLELLSPVTFGMGFGVDWWQEDYPELFAGEHVRDRVWLYELCCAVRALVWWPPQSPQRGDATDHPPVQRLRELVEAPTPW
ncbi:aminoglycoside phosphotransferase family protein [Nocardioides oleivorans]|uniref:Aminoglycoside phosphotransferase family protein n=1 Tax=Nocardioides oleivorans TaxID=273676 RepID=A0A4Q2S1V7_9ACTN|nr:aminoglycoside phosphotransferase family protein [Nocardioides oleivorans]RYB95537.1 aminoglycoside phosphotransferase family protein [Nocardioides oleivorans]